MGTIIHNFLLDPVVTLTVDRDLRQMGDAEHLMVLCDVVQLLPNHLGNCATHTGVDFVECVKAARADLTEYTLDRQHGARELSPACDLTQWPSRLAPVGGDEEFCSVETGGTETSRGAFGAELSKEFNLDLGVAHAERPELIANRLAQSLGRGMARAAQLLRGFDGSRPTRVPGLTCCF